MGVYFTVYLVGAWWKHLSTAPICRFTGFIAPNVFVQFFQVGYPCLETKP